MSMKCLRLWTFRFRPSIFQVIDENDDDDLEEDFAKEASTLFVDLSGLGSLKEPLCWDQRLDKEILQWKLSSHQI